MEPLSFTQQIQAYTTAFDCASDKKTLTKAIWDSLRQNFQTQLDDESISSLDKLKGVIVLANKPRLAAAIDAFIHKDSIFYRLPNDLRQEILSYLPFPFTIDHMRALDPRFKTQILWTNACRESLHDVLSQKDIMKVVQAGGSELKYFEVNYSAFSDLYNVLQYTPNLVTFIITNCHFYEKEERWLLEKLNPNLIKEIGIMSLSQTDGNAALLSAFSNMTTLNLRANKIHDVSTLLGNLPHLQTLDLSENALNPESINTLSYLTGLTKLDLKKVQIGDEGVLKISRLTDLTELNLRWVNLTISGVRHIASFKKLRRLNLSSNQIVNNTFGGSDGAIFIGTLTALTRLNLSTNYIEDRGVERLSLLTNLTHLNLSWNHIEENGAKRLTRFSRLICLDLTRNQIREHGAAAITALTNLERLFLGTNDLGNKGALCLKGFPKLKYLFLDDNDTTRTAENELRSAYTNPETGISRCQMHFKTWE